MIPELRLLIVDDEKPARDMLQTMIEKYCPGVTVTGQADSAESARRLAADQEIDALFLDIAMPNENGFDLLKSLEGKNYMYVFVTAHDQYAVRALRASAIDYLQKPVDIAELQAATRKLIQAKALREQSMPARQEYEQSLMSLTVNVSRQPVQRLCLPGMNGFTVIDVNDIQHLDADSNYTIFHLNNLKKIVVAKTLKEYEELLDPASFIRIHKSSIINLKYLKEFSRVDGYYAIMADNSSIAVSRRRLTEFLEAVDQYNR
jgi:two-component system LytT family response regulator